MGADAFQFWRDQLAGKNPELPPGPQCGYYRDRARAVAIWHDQETGELCCTVSSGPGKRDWQPNHVDEIDEKFGFCCRHPVSYESYLGFMNTGAWPEDVAERPVAEIAAKAVERQQHWARPADKPAAAPAEPGPGHNSNDLPAFELMRERIRDAGAQVADWFKSIGGEIRTKEHADKASNFKGLFGDLEKEAAAAHKTEKEPHLVAGRAVDAAWKPIIELADASKRKAAALLTPYLQEQDRIAREAAAKAAQAAREEAERLAATAAPDAFVPEDRPAPVAAPEPEKPRAGTRGNSVGLRTFKRVEIDDFAACVAYLAALDPVPPDLRAAVEKIADKILKSGVAVPGARIIEEKRAA